MEAKLKKRNDQDDVLLMAKRARQERDRAAVRSGVRTPDSMLTFDQEQVRATFVVRRRSVNY